MFVSAENEKLQYSGRIDFDEPAAPIFIYAASYVQIRFTGTSVRAILQNHRSYYTNDMGYILDGEQGRFTLRKDTEKETYLLAEKLAEGEHDLLLFKRMDGCHIVTFHGFELEDGASVLDLPQKPDRRIEVFGDSVSCGEVSEAISYTGREDPVHEGEYSNSWYSYAWIAARKLKAELHDTSQGGIALLDGTGWFLEPDYPGVESCYDKMEYNPQLGAVKNWDFSRYVPQVVIVAIGQNDSHPVDYMAKDYHCKQAVRWREHYCAFIENLMKIYPRAQIILTTTVLIHDANWDRSIGEVCQKIANERVHHFLYSQNGCGTPGHIRIQEAEQMAEELVVYIESLGEDIW